MALTSISSASISLTWALSEGRPDAAAEDAPLVETPDRELVRLGLISNRGFLVVAAVVGVLTQVDWWRDWLTDQDWLRFYETARDRGPGWLRQLIESGSITSKVLLGVLVFVLFLGLLRLLSIVWYLVRYRGFALRREHDDLRAEYGLLPRVSSVIPVHRIQLVTVTASLLHRWFDRESIEVETAGASEEESGLTQQLGASGIKLNRHRRSGMATLTVDTAGAGTIGHRVQIPYLDAGVAAQTLHRLYAECRATDFRW